MHHKDAGRADSGSHNQLGRCRGVGDVPTPPAQLVEHKPFRNLRAPCLELHGADMRVVEPTVARGVECALEIVGLAVKVVRLPHGLEAVIQWHRLDGRHVQRVGRRRVERPELEHLHALPPRHGLLNEPVRNNLVRRVHVVHKAVHA